MLERSVGVVDVIVGCYDMLNCGGSGNERHGDNVDWGFYWCVALGHILLRGKVDWNLVDVHYIGIIVGFLIII